MNQGGLGGQNNNRVQSFLEELRSRQVESGTRETGFMPFNGGMESFAEKKRIEEARKGEFFVNRKRESVEVFSATIKEKERRLEQIHEELVSMSQRVENVAPELHREVIQDIQRPQRYHEFLFDFWKRLINFLARFQDRSGDSREWRMRFQGRQMDMYSKLAKTGGTKYTQSIDISLARSVG